MTPAGGPVRSEAVLMPRGPGPASLRHEELLPSEGASLHAVGVDDGHPAHAARRAVTVDRQRHRCGGGGETGEVRSHGYLWIATHFWPEWGGGQSVKHRYSNAT